MDDRLNLEYCLTGYGFCLAMVVWWLGRRESITASLPICYLFALSMIHVPGAVVHMLPWNQLSGTDSVAVGFQECLVAVAACVGGIMAFDTINRRQLQAAMQVPEFLVQDPRMLRLPRHFVFLGVLFIGVFIPVLRHIPSFGAAASSGAYLMVVGVCLGCWQRWKQGQTQQMVSWMAAAAAFPLFTMVTMGFIGYGVSAFLVVMVFVGAFYRPRWRSVVVSVLLIFVGFSVFVTYMRDRTEFRQVVWGEQAYSNRFSVLWSMFSRFELFDPHNDQHLEAIDDRLNQNFLVGAAEVNLNGGSVPFANGQTIGDAFLAMTPRIIWPDKPMRAGSPEIVSKYTGIEFAEGTSVGVGQVLEFYINFGRWGVLIGFFCLGWLIRWVDWHAAARLRNGDWLGFMSWFLPGLTLLQPGGSLVELTASFASSAVLVLVLRYHLKQYSVNNAARAQAVNPLPEQPRRGRRRRPRGSLPFKA